MSAEVELRMLEGSEFQNRRGCSAKTAGGKVVHDTWNRHYLEKLDQAKHLLK